MSKKIIIFSIFLSIFVGIQIWCSYITFKYPYLGVYLSLNQQNEWVINYLDKEGAAVKLDLKVGDVIKQVDGKLAVENQMIYKWKVIEQAREMIISRDGTEQERLSSKKCNL